ncbi:LOW QUALITY PROTEIN: hypothetical protein PHMEG_0007805 [Phytophthora megakarya]|uniref:Reverse transcriptase n=1 Tax=Phytophthora megakarya TaxID=4795 RepID=A0A225WLL2_9STRA|nr:LOW QUALITY PROTEIN: hypothetical protein PHMEG_0007805 [Phytophthora megakarya]
MHPARFCGRILKEAEMNYPPRLRRKDKRYCNLGCVELEDSLATVTSHTKGSSTVHVDPPLLYARLPKSYCGFVVSFDGSAKTEKYGGYVAHGLSGDYPTGQ